MLKGLAGLEGLAGLTRRQLLGGAAIAAFMGYSRITVSDITGAIVMSRTSGQTPAFVQASASGISATGTSRPYEVLEYSWDFGDPAGVEVFTNPNTGASQNMNTQSGPEAAYCYRSAGSYTVTLTVRGKAASGYIEETFTQAVTVTAFSGTDYWFDSVAGSDANDGLSIGAPKQTITALNALIASNRRFNLARGSDWTGVTQLTITAAAYDGMRFQPYGSGAKPIFAVTGAGSGVTMTNGSAGTARNKNDIVFSGVDFRGSGTAGSRAVSINDATNATGTITNIYFDDCDMYIPTTSSGITLYIGTVTTSGIGVWGGQVTNQLTANLGNKHCVFGGALNWQFVNGCYMEGGGSNTTLDHHMYMQTQNHSLYRLIDFGPGAGRNYCINMSRTGNVVTEYGDYHLISDCHFSGTLRALDSSQTNNDPALFLFRSLVFEENYLEGLTGDGVFLFYGLETGTYRRNRAWGCDGGRFWAPDTVIQGIFKGMFYENLIYRAGAVSGANSGVVRIGSGFTLQQYITDNAVVDTRATARPFEIPFTAMTSAGSVIDGNQTYAPNDSSPFYDDSTEKTFAEWQAAGWDTSGSNTDPGWNDPANGDFS